MNIAVVYWSGTGNTERMAEAVAEGIRKNGCTADLITADSFSKNSVGKYERMAFGCPSMGDEELEEDEFEPMFSSIESLLKGKTVALFGSYGWGDGEWMRRWEDRVRDIGATLLGDGLTVHETPGTDDIADCEELGRELAGS